jgi:hypothetical protein
MNNPYIEELDNRFEWEKDDFFDDIMGYRESSENDLTKWDMRLKYSFAIPNEKAINKLVSLSPLIEIGAGSGYWSNLISNNGGDIVAFDNFSREDQFDKEWFDVSYGTPEKVEKYANRNLFLCWPEYDDPMGYQSVKKTKGNFIILVGENENGCTGTKRMYYKIKEDYELKEVIDIPKWYNNRDSMFIYERKDF